MLAILLQFQRLFLPSLILLTGWAAAMTIFRKDTAVGFVLYLSLIIIVDWYLNTGIYIPGLQYGSIRYSEVLLIFLFAAAPKAPVRSGLHRFTSILIWLYFLLFFIAALHGLTLIDGLNNFRRFMVPQILTFWVAQRGFRNGQDYQRFFSYLIILLILIGLFTFWDVFFDRILLHSESIDSAEYYVNRKHGRFGSFFLNPIDLGDFALLLLPVMLLTIRAQQTLLRRMVFWAGFLLFAFAFVKTQSRGPMIGLVASATSFALLPYKPLPLRRRLLSIALLLCALASLLPGFYETATRRFEDVQQETSADEISRASTWNHVIDNLILTHPFFGIGLGEAQFVQSMHETGFVETFGRTLDNPHNSYLEIAVAAGCPALLIFFAINLLVIATNLSFMRGSVVREHGLVLLGLTSGLVGFLVATTSGQDMFRTSVAPLYWLIIGLCLSITSAKPLVTADRTSKTPPSEMRTQAT